jgi:hypothetical protein
VNITCTTTSFAVGGSLVGLLGTGLVLQNNLGADLPITPSSARGTAPPTAAPCASRKGAQGPLGGHA